MELQRRSAERAAALAHRNAERIVVQTRARIDAQVRSQIRSEIGRNRHYYGYSYNSRSAENAGAQIGSDADPCRDNSYGDRDDERFCEVRESTMPAGPLNVDAGNNGGISIEGWDRNEIRVRAVVQASAPRPLKRARSRVRSRCRPAAAAFTRPAPTAPGANGGRSATRSTCRARTTSISGPRTAASPSSA
jgi:hypothetical protein